MANLNVDDLLSMLLVLIMFSIGATLRFSDFRRIFWQPRSLGIGLFLQMIFLPILTFCIISCTELHPFYKVGFIIVSLCPGGTTSNFISYLVNADVALSISLTTINSFLILLTIPFGVNIALDYFIGSETQITLEFGETLVRVFSLILLPAFLGVCFNQYLSKLSLRLRMPLKYINAALLAIVYTIKFLGSEEVGGSGVSFADIKQLLPVAILLQIISMLIAYWLATKILKRSSSCLTIGIEVGLQNTALALLIASEFLSNSAMSKPALIYAMFSFFTTLLFAWIIYRFVILKQRQKWNVNRPL